MIRVWLEEGVEQDALRARITQTLDISTSSTAESAAASEDEVLAAVADWLRAFVEAGGDAALGRSTQVS